MDADVAESLLSGGDGGGGGDDDDDLIETFGEPMTESDVQNVQSLPPAEVSGLLASKMTLMMRARKRTKYARERYIKPLSKIITWLERDIKRIMAVRRIQSVKLPKQSVNIQRVVRPPPKSVPFADIVEWINADLAEYMDDAQRAAAVASLRARCTSKHEKKLEKCATNNESYKMERLCFNPLVGGGSKKRSLTDGAKELPLRPMTDLLRTIDVQRRRIARLEEKGAAAMLDTASSTDGFIPLPPL